VDEPDGPDREPMDDPTDDRPPPGGEPDDRESAYALLQRGQALSAARHYAQAAVVLARADRIEPGRGSILELLGRACYMSRQWDEAAGAFERLLEVDPSAHYAHYALGQSRKQQGRMADARLHLRLAVALSPGSRLYRDALGRLPHVPRGRSAARPDPGDGDR
jgi:tetratricopeptide (TPR) repeat protein